MLDHTADELIETIMSCKPLASEVGEGERMFNQRNVTKNLAVQLSDVVPAENEPPTVEFLKSTLNPRPVFGKFVSMAADGQRVGIAVKGEDIRFANNQLGPIRPEDIGKGLEVVPSHTLGFDITEEQPRAIASDGSTLWFAGADTNALYTLNTTTGVATRVGTATDWGVSESEVAGMAYGNSNLYMVGSNSVLYTVNTGTGVATQVGTTTAGFGVGENNATGLSFVGAVLYMVGSDTRFLYRLALSGGSAGSATRVSSTLPTASYMAEMHGVIYMTGGTAPDDRLHTLDLTTGVITVIGPAGFGIGETAPRGIASDDSNLYLVGDTKKTLCTIKTSGPNRGTATQLNIISFGVGETVPESLATDGETTWFIGNTTNALYTLNLTTGEATRVGNATNFGPAGESSPSGLVYFNSTLYMVGSSNKKLYEVDTTDGTASLIGYSGFNIEEHDPTAITTDGSSTWMVGKDNPYLMLLDTSTGEATRVGGTVDPVDQFGINASEGGAIATDGTTVWFIPYDETGTTSRLHTLNMETGQATLVSGAPDLHATVGRPIESLAYGGASGHEKLYVVGSSRILYTINTSDGTASRVGSTPAGFGTDATTPFALGFHANTDTLYFADGHNEKLSTLNLTSGAASFVTNTITEFHLSITSPRALATDGTDMWFGVGGSQNRLYRIDPESSIALGRVGFQTNWGISGLTEVYSMAYGGSPAKLYAVGNDRKLYTIETSGVNASRATQVGSTAAGYGVGETMTGIAFVGSTLYAAGETNDRLYTLSLTTGSASSPFVWPTNYGSTGTLINVIGMVKISTTVYISTNTALYSLNLSTGVATSIGSYTFGSGKLMKDIFTDGTTLYGLESTEHKIYRINTGTAATTNPSPALSRTDIESIVHRSSTFYGTSSSALYTIAISTGVCTASQTYSATNNVVRITPHASVSGLTTNNISFSGTSLPSNLSVSSVAAVSGGNDWDVTFNKSLTATQVSGMTINIVGNTLRIRWPGNRVRSGRIPADFTLSGAPSGVTITSVDSLPGQDRNDPQNEWEVTFSRYLTGTEMSALTITDAQTPRETMIKGDNKARTVNSKALQSLTLPTVKFLATDGTNMWIAGSGATDQKLYTVSLTTGNVTAVAPSINNFNITGMTAGTLSYFDSKLYVINNTSRRVYEVNTTTSVASIINIPVPTQFSVSEGSPRGLASDGSTLWMSGGDTDAIYRVNTGTGVATIVGSAFTSTENNPRDLTYYNGNLYLLGDQTNKLYQVNTSTGALTKKDTAVAETNFGLGSGIGPVGLAQYDRGDLYIIGETNVSLFQLTLATGIGSARGVGFQSTEANPRDITFYNNQLYLTGNGGLYIIDRDDGELEDIGPAPEGFGVNEIEPSGLAPFNRSKIYLVGNSQKNLYEVNKVTGRAKRIGLQTNFGITGNVPEIRDLARDNLHTIWLLNGENATLYTLDTRNGSASAVGSGFSSTENDPQGIAYHGSTLYMVGSQNDGLYTLDTSAGTATRVPSSSPPTQFGKSLNNPRGLSSISSSLYMLATDDEGTLWTLDTSTGVATQAESSPANFGVSEMLPRDLTTDGSTVYMIGGTNNCLYTLDTFIGQATRVGSASNWGSGNETAAQGIAHDGTTLYMVGSGNDALYTVNTTDGTAARVDATTTSFGTSPAIADPKGLLALGTRLYMLADDGNGSLWTVHKTDETATRVNPPIVDFGQSITAVYGLTADRSTLWMMGNTASGPAVYTLDKTNGNSTKLGGAGSYLSISTPSGIAYHNSTLYITDNTADAIYTFNQTNGSLTRIGSATEFGASIDDSRDIIFSSGTLYMLATDDGGTLWSVNITTGVATLVTKLTDAYSVNENRPTGLASNGTILWMVGAGNARLYTINTSNGVATAIGTPLSARDNDPQGLTYFNSKLYLVGGQTDCLYEVNTATASLNRISQTDTVLAEAGKGYVTPIDVSSASRGIIIGGSTAAAAEAGENFYRINL